MAQIVLATSNRGKLVEIKDIFGDEVVAYSELIEPFEIVEDGDTFAQNALIKARAIYERLPNESMVMADDSGISVPLLGGEPSIYSARYAGENATDTQNLQKLISKLKDKNVKKTKAYYTAAIALVCKEGEFVVHGWMHGDVIDEPIGSGGFGYDPIFIPDGYNQTLGELSNEIKNKFSHRSKALKLIEPILEMIKAKR